MRTILAPLIALMLAGCTPPDRHRYTYDENGSSIIVQLGTVVAVRNVDIAGQNMTAGSGVGAVADAAPVLAARGGIAYTVALENGKTVTILQEQRKNTKPFATGDRVMVQARGVQQRVLPIENPPAELARPKGGNVVD